MLAVYRATTDQVPKTTDEATEVRAFAPDELPWGELAFWSTELALRDLQNERVGARLAIMDRWRAR